MATTQGIVTLVQEDRFMVLDARGRNALYVLSHDADLDPSDLIALVSAARPVTIHWQRAGDLVARIAHRVEPIR